MSSWDTTRFGGATNPQTQTQDIEQDAPETNPKSQDAPVVEVHPHTETVDDSRAAFLATFTPKEQKEIIRKVDRRILVLIGLIYLVKQIDVNNAANVKVLAVGKPTNIMTQLSMTADQCNWVQSIYYISYILFELPSNLLLKWMSPRVFQARICSVWGLVLACHAAVTNKEGLYAARFFLGLAEAGLFPAIITHLCSWYRSDEMGKPIMWLFGIFNLAGVVGSLLVYAISYLDGRQELSSWQWVFLLEGTATMSFAAIIYLLYPDYPLSPQTSTWLTPREQRFIETRLPENAPRTHDAAFSRPEVTAALTDPRTWSFMLAQVCKNTGGFGLTWFLPTITTNLGFAGLPRNQLLNIPPAGAGIGAIIAVAWVLKKAVVPRPAVALVIVGCEVVTLAVFLASGAPGAVYTACVLGSMFGACLAVPFWAWRTASLRGSTGTAVAMGLQSGVGQVGGVIGPQIFRERFAAGGYRVSYAICVGALGGCFLFNCVNWWLTWELEGDVRRVRRERIRAGRAGRMFTGEDVAVFDQRQRDRT